MKKTLSLLAISVFAVACASSDSDEPQRRPSGGSGRRGRMERQAPLNALDIIPLTDWWHEPAISTAVNLSADQVARLDKIADQRDEISRLDRDSATAMRDLRQAVESDPSAINTAAQRVRSLRDSLFDRQVRMIASERDVLTPDQWQTLMRELRRDREDPMDGRRGFGGPGSRRGGFGGGGRGRWPGF